MSDQVVTTIQIPDWAHKVLHEKFEHIIDDDYIVDFTQATPKEAYFDSAYGRVWTMICENAPQGNAPVEAILREHCAPYDKWFGPGVEVDAGREWYRYDDEGNETRREIYDNDHPNYEELFAARQRRVERSPDGTEDFANKRFASSLRSWWEDHKPLEPKLTECKPNKKFLELSKSEE